MLASQSAEVIMTISISDIATHISQNTYQGMNVSDAASVLGLDETTSILGTSSSFFNPSVDIVEISAAAKTREYEERTRESKCHLVALRRCAGRHVAAHRVAAPARAWPSDIRVRVGGGSLRLRLAAPALRQPAGFAARDTDPCTDRKCVIVWSRLF